jgi:DNA-binding PadR family transcriptional regulator
VNVYPVLKDLEEQGSCARAASSPTRAMRKIYEITAKGVAEFEQWIELAPEDSLPAETDLIALKLVLAPRPQRRGTRWLSRSLAELDEEIAAGARTSRRTRNDRAPGAAHRRVSAALLRAPP